MRSMLTKKKVLLISMLIGGGLLLLEPISTSTICGAGSTICIDTIFSLAMTLFVFLFVFPFSLITYFLPETVFRTWVNFAKWWVPFQILLVAITPESNGNFLINIVDKQFAAIILSGFFALISLLIIIWKYVTAQRK